MKVFEYDLPEDIDFHGAVAIDTEAMGLKPIRDRLCLIQLADKDGNSFLVHFPKHEYHQAKNVKKLLADDKIIKIFHFARFDLAILYHYLNVQTVNVFCTKVASKLTRTYSNKHGLKELCHEILGIELNKQQQQSDWGSGKLTLEQQKYAVQDVIHLHQLKSHLEGLLKREQRQDVAQACFEYLPYRARLDLLMNEEDPLNY